MAASGGYAAGSPDYSYWPDYGWGYPFVGLPAFGAGAGRFHRVAGHRFSGPPPRSMPSGPQPGSSRRHQRGPTRRALIFRNRRRRTGVVSVSAVGAVIAV